MTKIEQARRILAVAIEATVDQVPADGRLDTISGWDSLAHMRIVLDLESQLGRPLAANEIINLKSVADISALI